MIPIVTKLILQKQQNQVDRLIGLTIADTALDN